MTLNAGLLWEFMSLPVDAEGRDAALVNLSDRTARTGQMLYPVGFFDLAFEDVQQYDIDGVTVTQRQNAGRITGISWTREGYEYLLYSLQPEMNMIAGLAVEFVTNTRAEAVV